MLVGLSIYLVRFVRFAVAPHENLGTQRNLSFFPSRCLEKDEYWHENQPKPPEIERLETALRKVAPTLIEMMVSE